jgi:hypothetical protein
MINKEIYITKLKKITGLKINYIYIGNNKKLMVDHTMGDNAFYFLQYFFNLETKINQK